MNYFAGRTGAQTIGVPTMAAPSMPTLPSLVDFTRFLSEGLLQPLLQGLNTAAQNFADSVSALSPVAMQPTMGRQRAKDSCWEGEDPCHCTCCISDADLIIYARLGERRVVPVTIENPRARE